ncbi:MAG: hypothetical protein ACK4TA_21135 [Saprospiraceae bacterium]
MTIEARLMEKIQLLNAQQIAELQLFIEFLLAKPALRAKLEEKPNTPLQGLQRIPVPVNEVIIDRSSIYEDRI